MNKYKITYWNNGNILVKKIEALDVKEAEYKFYMTTACDDIKSIEVVEE